MRKIIARQNETWDIIAKRELGYEFFAKDIMLINQELSDVAMFDGGEEVNIPEFDIDTDENALEE